ncbi:MAG: class II fructose-bisphosphate aldolase [Erysipelotrichia bacterium]|nr:class II fructose-bisphosphate aldolase [Erysipelotrichia bacterium]
MLVGMKEILVKARKEGYGVIAPTIKSMEEIKVSIDAAEKKNSAVILNFNITYDWVKRDEDLELAAYIARERAIRSTVPVCVNLDHGKDYECVMRAIKYGFGSVMIDASYKTFEENVEITKKVCETAHAAGLSVEAELGCVGMADPSFTILGKYTQTTETDPDVVVEFVKRTNVDFLAISIGNAHGPYAKDIVPHLNFELLQKIAAATPIPLVLHGGSGTGDENMGKACTMGICKINVATDLSKEGVKVALDALNKDEKHGRLDFIQNYNTGFQNKIEYYMDVFGSTGKAF